MGPEIAISHPLYAPIWNSRIFAQREKLVIIDEGHAISVWGRTFRSSYVDIGRLKFLFPRETTTFYLTSATLPKKILGDVRSIAGLRADRTTLIHRTVDRPNLHYAVVPIRYPLHTKYDLGIVVKRAEPGLPVSAYFPLGKTVVFFPRRQDAEMATIFLKSRLPGEMRDMVIWYHAGMTDVYRNDSTDAVRDNRIMVVCASKCFSMVRSYSNATLFWLSTDVPLSRVPIFPISNHLYYTEYLQEMRRSAT